MRKFLCLLLIFFASCCVASADKFFKDQDIFENRYYDTLGYAVGEVAENGKCPNCVEYDATKVYGSFSSDIISYTHIDDITDPDPVYGLMRLHNLFDELSLPPYSRVDFIYWSKNTSDSDVNITAIKMFLSRHYSYQGDLTKILDISGEYEILPVKYIVWEYPRNGIVKTYEGLGIVKSGEGVVRGMRLDSAYVKSPILFVKWEAQEISEDILLRVYVRNESEILLKNIKYEHNQFSLTRDFQAGEEFVYEYVVDNPENGNLGYAGIYNPNERSECIARGEHLESNFVGDSPVVGGIREEDGGYLAYIGSRVKPFGHRFCVNVIPYTLYSSEIQLPRDEQEPVVQEERIPDTVEEVFGVKKLPQTGESKSLFLVVFQILWYYLSRRNIL